MPAKTSSPRARGRAGGILGDEALSERHDQQRRRRLQFLAPVSRCPPIPGYDSVDSVEEIVSIYRQHQRGDFRDLRAHGSYRVELGRSSAAAANTASPVRRCNDITMAMAYQDRRLEDSPAVAVNSAAPAMESVKLCDECGVCLERLPL